MFGRGWEDGLTAKARRRLGWGWVGIFQRRDAETRRSQRGAELGWMGGWVDGFSHEGEKARSWGWVLGLWNFWF